MDHNMAQPKGPPASFIKKKSQILADVGHYDSSEYSDKSPKGTIDAEIIDLIHEINTFEKYVTTSSCAGRVAVFVEGKKASLSSTADDVGAGPGGKGFGNKWLYVSHSPVKEHTDTKSTLHDLFQLQPKDRALPVSATTRLIKLNFSPLILHIFCADLFSAKSFLAASINAGFRESGVQSLKALHDPEAGAMVGVRTAGLAFEAVVGYVDERGPEEVYRSCVDEDFLRLCVVAIDERFEWNRVRKERLRKELKSIGLDDKAWEDKDARRARKRLEGLRRQKDAAVQEQSTKVQDVLQEGMLDLD